MNSRNRIEIMHGVNLDQLGRRDPHHYGSVTFDQLERRIGEFALELGLEVRFFHTNHEGEFVEHLHGLEGTGRRGRAESRARGPTTPTRSAMHWSSPDCRPSRSTCPTSMRVSSGGATR